MHRRACLLTLLTASCSRAAGRDVSDPTPAPPVPAPGITRAPYGALRARIEAIRDELAERNAAAGDEPARRAVRIEARKALQSTFSEVLLPAWLGTRWAFNGTADEPLAPEGIACGYFVATTLQHVGLRLESRRRFGQSPALTIARSLIPPGPSHHRVFSVPASALEQKVRSFGDGVHLLGLDVHVGFLVVDADTVRVVHSSYTGKRTVVSEPITACEAIERSRPKGYHVTSLFSEDALVDAWLTRTTIPLHEG